MLELGIPTAFSAQLSWKAQVKITDRLSFLNRLLTQIACDEKNQPHAVINFNFTKTSDITITDFNTKEDYTLIDYPPLDKKKPDDLSEIDSFKFDLEQYRDIREQLLLIGGLKYYSVFSRICGIDGDAKIAAANKVMDLLSGDSITPFSRKEIRALKEGDLGKIIKKYREYWPPLLQEALEEVKVCRRCCNLL